MINVQEIKKVEGIHKYKDVYIVDVLFNRNGIWFKIRYPYKLQSSAQQAITAMKIKQQSEISAPDFKPCILVTGYENQRG